MTTKRRSFPQVRNAVEQITGGKRTVARCGNGFVTAQRNETGGWRIPDRAGGWGTGYTPEAALSYVRRPDVQTLREIAEEFAV